MKGSHLLLWNSYKAGCCW